MKTISILAISAAVAITGLVDVPVAGATPMPQLVRENGKFALMVDGAPFLLLGGQANNSSNYPAELDKVWPAIRDMDANTLVMPVSWEQVEPTEGRFDFSFVDTLIAQAREHNVRLGILWFGTWKNTGPAYTPTWVKTDNKRFPRIVTKEGWLTNTLSPFFDSTREADKRAYVELVKHIKAIDGERHTVIMLQIENELGVWGTVRDHSAPADAAIKETVPEVLVKHMGKQPGPWHEVFGGDADEFFQAWSFARYCDDIAAAGKAVYPLPTYMNDMLRDPTDPKQKPGEYASGGPTFNVLDIYKAAAPHIDILAPDMYDARSKSYEATVNDYARPDNALYIAESGNKAVYAHYIFTALGHHGIGFDPFGFDYTGYSNYPYGAKDWGPDTVKPFGTVYKLFRNLERVWPKLSLEGQVWGVSEPDDYSAQDIDLGPDWNAHVSYRQWEIGDPDPKIGYPEGSDIPDGGVAIAKLSENEFLVAGLNARVTFGAGPANRDKVMMLDRVEEGHFDASGNWVFERVWNGDQTGSGLNLTNQPRLLKVRLATFTR